MSSIFSRPLGQGTYYVTGVHNSADPTQQNWENYFFLPGARFLTGLKAFVSPDAALQGADTPYWLQVFSTAGDITFVNNTGQVTRFPGAPPGQAGNWMPLAVEGPLVAQATLGGSLEIAWPSTGQADNLNPGLPCELGILVALSQVCTSLQLPAASAFGGFARFTASFYTPKLEMAEGVWYPEPQLFPCSDCRRYKCSCTNVTRNRNYRGPGGRRCK